MADVPPIFTVHTPHELVARLREWGRQMRAAGRRADSVAALREMNTQLTQAPVIWGDPLKEYQHLEAFEIRGLIPKWFLVWYGVDARARVVIVRDIQPAPGSPFA